MKADYCRIKKMRKIYFKDWLVELIFLEIEEMVYLNST